MADKVWSGKRLEDLLTLTPKQLQKKYPEYSENYLSVQKSRVSKRILKRIARMERDPGYEPTPEQLDEIDRVRELLQDFQDAGLPVKPEDAEQVQGIRIWTQHSVDRETGEPIQMVNRYVNMKPTPDQQWPQATAADIRPTKRKSRKEEGVRRILIFSDPQIGFRRIIDREGNDTLQPIHDPRSIRLMQMIAADMQPDEIWNAGDTIDLPELSRFAPDSDHFFKTMGASFQAVHDMYAQLRADNPDTRIIEVDSNHNDRLKKAVLKFFPQAYDMYRPGEESEYPMLSYPYMANLEAIDIEFVGGYGAAQYEYGKDYYEELDGRMVPKPMVILRHGTETSNNGSTAGKVYKNNPDVISVQGHDHEMHQYFRLNRLGQMVGAIIVPPLCKSTGEVPSYHSAISPQNQVVPTQEAWPNGVVELVDRGGEYEFNVTFFRNGIAHYRNRVYDANS